MKNRDDLRTWWYWELLKEERRWGKDALQPEDVRFEMGRRLTAWKMWAVGVGMMGAFVVAIAVVTAWLHSR